MVLHEAIADVSLAFIREVRKLGIATAANVAIMAITIIISTRVNPLGEILDVIKPPLRNFIIAIEFYYIFFA